MAELYAEGRKSAHETAKEIMSRLEQKNNYIPSSEIVRREYAYALMREYKKFIRDRSDRDGGQAFND